MKYIFMGLY